jgi:hypothetical protein
MMLGEIIKRIIIVLINDNSSYLHKKKLGDYLFWNFVLIPGALLFAVSLVFALVYFAHQQSGGERPGRAATEQLRPL